MRSETQTGRGINFLLNTRATPRKHLRRFHHVRTSPCHPQGRRGRRHLARRCRPPAHFSCSFASPSLEREPNEQLDGSSRMVRGSRPQRRAVRTPIPSRPRSMGTPQKAEAGVNYEGGRD
jgi:hypothetical protein